MQKILDTRHFEDVAMKQLNNAISHQIGWWSLKCDASYGDAAQTGSYNTHAYVDRCN